MIGLVVGSVTVGEDRNGKGCHMRSHVPTIGQEWTKNYPGTRTTATVVDNLLYLESGMGVVYCLDSESEEPVWSVDLLATFQAKNIQWGMAESVLIDGDHLRVQVPQRRMVLYEPANRCNQDGFQGIG